MLIFGQLKTQGTVYGHIYKLLTLTDIPWTLVPVLLLFYSWGMLVFSHNGIGHFNFFT